MVRKLTINEEMSYDEFRKDYKWALKQYPDASYLFNNDKIKITMTTVNYEKSGSRFVETDRDENEITWVQYFNVIDATPFFKNLGGTERVTKSYTKAGYIPTRITSVSPDRNKKTVREIRFD